MTSKNSTERVLALDIRARRFGFVVFEGSEQLLDWGVRKCNSEKESRTEVARRKIMSLLNIYAPLVVVAGQAGENCRHEHGSVKAITKMLRKEIAIRSLRLHVVSGQQMKNHFRRFGCSTKYEMASALAKKYPDIAWKLPPKRKPWRSEYQRMSIFDAATLGVSYLIEKHGEGFCLVSQTGDLEK